MKTEWKERALEMHNENMGLDPKGNVVIAKGERLGEREFATILFRPTAESNPFLVADGYEAQTGSWAEAREYATLVAAWEASDPSILGLFPVGDGDVCAALERSGFEPSDGNIEKVVADGFDELVWAAIADALDARVANTRGLDGEERR